MNKIKDIEILQAASAAFATEHIPADWYFYTDLGQKEWLDSHRLAPFEDMPTGNFYELIADHASTIEDLVNSRIKILKMDIIYKIVGHPEYSNTM